MTDDHCHSDRNHENFGMPRSLAPEHLADLHKSGLTDETIVACGFESSRPTDLPHHGVESAYEIPYFNLDGTKNCFRRLKVFPAQTDVSGHQQKYHQEKGTAPSLYLPPTITWKSIVDDVQQMVVITEGEKKATSLCQCGVPTIGVAGTWNWRQKLDSGDRLVIPTFDQFIWKGRRVELVPDSDCWRAEKHHALSGFYALAMELVLRGAEVVFVILQDVAGRKAGLDDWLVSRQADWQHQWPMLERIQLDEKRLAKVAKWWQDWKTKAATQEALRDRVADDLILTEAVGLYVVRSAAHALTFEFDNLHTHRSSVSAEVTVRVEGVELISQTDLSLKDPAKQTTLARNLQELCWSIGWRVLVPKACALVLKRFRQGAPILWVDEKTLVEQLSFVVNPLVMKNKPTVMFADGGQGKSTLAVMTTLLVTKGTSVAGFSGVKGRALYLDWEDDDSVFTRRHHAIQAAHPELRGEPVGYLACTQPLARMTQELSRRIQREGITYLVIDSLLKAAGGGSDAETTEQLFAALRILNTATLIIAHVPKPQANGPTTPTIYGSVFSSNFARSTWELKTEQEIGEDSAVIGLFHRKSNLTRKHAPLGIKVTQDKDTTVIRYESHDLTQTEEIKRGLPIPSQIRNLLDDGVHRTAKRVANDLGLLVEKVKSPLSKGVKHNKWMAIRNEGQEDQYTVLNPRNQEGA